MNGVFEAGGLLRTSSAARLEDFLRRQHGVGAAAASPVSQMVSVQYGEAALTADDVRALIERFGCSCGGEVVPCHLCRDERPAVMGSTIAGGDGRKATGEHAGHSMPTAAMPMAPPADHTGTRWQRPQWAHPSRARWPMAMGRFYPTFGLILRPEIAAISMAGSSFLVAVNALLLKRTKLEGIRRYGAQ